ncbi:hypothetical protein HaLaN_09911, partial [Haematococcus lacustris]
MKGSAGGGGGGSRPIRPTPQKTPLTTPQPGLAGRRWGKAAQRLTASAAARQHTAAARQCTAAARQHTAAARQCTAAARQHSSLSSKKGGKEAWRPANQHRVGARQWGGVGAAAWLGLDHTAASPLRHKLPAIYHVARDDAVQARLQHVGLSEQTGCDVVLEHVVAGGQQGDVHAAVIGPAGEAAGPDVLGHHGRGVGHPGGQLGKVAGLQRVSAQLAWTGLWAHDPHKGVGRVLRPHMQCTPHAQYLAASPLGLTAA